MGWLRIAVLVAVALVLAAAAYVCIGLGRAPIPGVAYSWRVTSNPRSGPLADSSLLPGQLVGQRAGVVHLP